jgi:hypothetical protein
MIEPGRWERVALYALYGLVGCVLFMGLNAVMLSRATVPDYDALSYTDAALRVYLGLSGADFNVTKMSGLGRVVWAGLPFTNTLDVLLVALLFEIIDYHIAVWLIHSAYVILFVWLARRLLGSATTLVLFSCAVAHSFFLHQYVNLISEMKVGLLLALFVVYLFNERIERHRAALAWITVLLLFARTINLAFILPLVALHLALRWRRRRGEALAAMKSVGLPILVLSPMLLYHAYYMFQYMADMGEVIRNWQDMTGVYNKLDLLKSYAREMGQYHAQLATVYAVALITGVAAYALWRPAQLRYFRDATLAFVVVFAVLMQAHTNNVMVVYWVFILAAVCLTLLLRGVAKERYLVVAGIVLAAVALRQSGLNFLQYKKELARGRPVIEMANALVKRIAAVDAPELFSNFGGVGALDPYGFELALRRTIPTPSVDALNYATPVEAYMEAFSRANIALVANRSFLWPAYVGINGKTAEIAALMAKEGPAMGFQAVERVFFDSDPTRYIDVYVRPTALVKLKYAAYNDMWLDAETPIVIKSPGPSLDGYVLSVDVMSPGGVSDPAFTYPFTATLADADGRPRRTVAMKGPGNGTLPFPLDGLPPGVYRLQFDKTFKPAGEDHRQLSVMYLGSRMVHPGTGGK